MGQRELSAIVWRGFFAIFFISCITIHAEDKGCDSCSYTLQPPQSDVLENLLTDAWYLHVNILSWDTVKLLALFTPWYIITRHVDHPVHNLFYRQEDHINICQWAHSVHSAADKSALGISIALAALSLNPWDAELARASRVFASGLVPIWIIKNIFKTIRHDGCLRPRCEFFDKHKIYYGGCPSGHMAFITYATTFYGLHYGPLFWIPLGAASVAIFCSSVNSNRHFVSQLVAGVGLGAIYGVAAHKVVDAYNCYDVECGLGTDAWGRPAVEVGYSF